MNVYEKCPVLENEKYRLRLVNGADTGDLLKVYSDLRAVPLFNSDNCNGDDFHYTTYERMEQAVGFWIQAYENGWFVRWSVVDKAKDQAVGTIEEFHRDAEDYFTNCGLLRLDLHSDYERAEEIESILSLIVPASFDLFGCDKVATKALPAATERIRALEDMGFLSADEKLIGHDGTRYDGYFVLARVLVSNA